MDSLGLTDSDLSNDSTTSAVDDRLYCSGTFELGTNLSRTESLSSSSLGDRGENENDLSSSSSSSSLLDIYEKESLTNVLEANRYKDNVETISFCIYDRMRENILDDYMLSFSFDSDDDIYVDSGLSLDDDDRHYDKAAIEKGLLDVSSDETYDDDDERVAMNTFPALPILKPMIDENESGLDFVVDNLIHDKTCSSDTSLSTQSNKEIVENTKKTKAFDCIPGRFKPSPPRKLLNRLTKTILKSDGSSERKQDNMNRKSTFKQLLKYNMKETDCYRLLSTNCSAEFEELRNDCDTKRDTTPFEATTALMILAKTLMKRVKNRRDKTYLPIQMKEEPCMTISPVNTSLSCSSMIDDSYQASLEENKHKTFWEDKYQIKAPSKDLWVIEEYLHEESSQGSWFVEETADNCFLSYQRSFKEEQFIETLFPLSYKQRVDEDTESYEFDQEDEIGYIDRYSVYHFSEESDLNDIFVMESQSDLESYFESYERDHSEQRFCRSVEERSLMDEVVRSSNKLRKQSSHMNQYESHSPLPKDTIAQPPHINQDECQEMMTLSNAPQTNISKTPTDKAQSVKELASFFEGQLGLKKHDCTNRYIYKTMDDELHEEKIVPIYNDFESNKVACDNKSSSDFSISVLSTNDESWRSPKNESKGGKCYGTRDLPITLKLSLKQYEDTQQIVSAKPGTLVKERVHDIDSDSLDNVNTSTTKDTPKRLLPALELWEKAKQQAQAEALN